MTRQYIVIITHLFKWLYDWRRSDICLKNMFLNAAKTWSCLLRGRVLFVQVQKLFYDEKRRNSRNIYTNRWVMEAYLLSMSGNSLYSHLALQAAHEIKYGRWCTTTPRSSGASIYSCEETDLKQTPLQRKTQQ